MTGYLDYYKQTIEHYETGLKLVVGGTGLGKTSSIKAVVRDLPQERKAIYIANRIQLLEEMVERGQGFKPEEVAFLRRDFEVVLNTIATMKADLYALLDDDLFRAYAGSVDITRLKQSCTLLEDLREQVGGPFIPKLLEEKAEEKARQVLADFKTVILTAKQKRKKDYGKLLDHPVIQGLFPFIRFLRRPEVRILLVTLHKAFYGFFDGSETLSLSRLSGYLIFLDEFDFLENDLIGLICRSPQIDDPFQFVEFFYEQMRRHKLGLDIYPVSGGENIRRRLIEIQSEIELLQRSGIRYPEINQFICKAPQINAAVFRTTHSVSTAPLYLCQTNRAFEVVFDRNAPCDGNVFPARRLLSAVSAVSERILTLLKELETDDPETHRDLMRDCYRNTAFLEQLPQISQFPRRRFQQLTRLGSLLESGYSLYDIKHLEKQTDPEEVELRHYAIYVTPEKLVATLAMSNLVFGLSATADIPRCLNHFDLSWLGDREQVNLIPIDDYDQQIVETLNAQKAQARGNQIVVARLPELDDKTTLKKALRHYINFIASDERFGEDTGGGHLKRRIERFFSSVLWACNRPAEVRSADSHLMFLNTFHQIKFMFEQAPKPQDNIFLVQKRDETRPFTAYDFRINDQDFIIVFYDAEQAKRLRKSRELEDLFNALFWQGVPVVVVTQYLSAGNGVNLQYRPTPDSADDEKQDFVNLHLLETPYFYFGMPDEGQTNEERAAILKENIWYQAKLHASKYISEPEFKVRLGKLHHPTEWNNQYQGHPNTSSDYALNSMAAFIQALGRSERVWRPMPDQTVIMSGDVHVIFQRFLISPEFQFIRETRTRIISSNLQQVLTQIEAQSQQIELEIARKADSRLAAANTKCIEKLNGLINQFPAVRQAINDTETRRNWAALRRAALKHDFADEVLQRYACFFKSPYAQRGIVVLGKQNEVIPPDLNHPDTYQWRLNLLYDVINDNRIIREHFNQYGYELSFNLDKQHFFVPYFYQAVLAGAIGEEAIMALLEAADVGFEDVPNSLFEVADLKIAGVPWYIDAKNYSETTLDRFALSPDDALFQPKLYEPYFKERATEKWHMIAAEHGPDSRLIYINLASAHERPLGYVTQDFTPVYSLADAQIIVVQGALRSENPNEYHEAFERFLSDLTIRISQ
ncbi:MAG: hypothetical protein HS103_06395 [Anaerolineales bacterium]|nr:hypothetical protein [Anaerolineales bacterium]